MVFKSIAGGLMLHINAKYIRLFLLVASYCNECFTVKWQAKILHYVIIIIIIKVLRNGARQQHQGTLMCEERETVNKYINKARKYR